MMERKKRRKKIYMNREGKKRDIIKIESERGRNKKG
jgi:hypothetical protein